ncbi:epoxide hydrolase N-terminal domain-containing protein [Saccharothrix isguenensis]
MITPFTLDVPQADLDDLADRLARTRWPEELPDAGFDYGSRSPTSAPWPTTGGTPTTGVPVLTLAEPAYPIEHWSEFDRGGHFAAMEVPDLLAEDVRHFFTGRSCTATGRVRRRSP